MALMHYGKKWRPRVRFRTSMRLQKVRARRLLRRDAFFLLINAVKCDWHANGFALQTIYTWCAQRRSDLYRVIDVKIELNVE